MSELDSQHDEKATRFKEKHSLDSDEEDNNTKYDVLAEDDIEGQEEATIEFDENIQITPFNMREEMEEGHFDKDGTFIFDKAKEVHDSWIDNIDWVKVKHLKPEEANRKRPFQYSDDSDEESDEEKKQSDITETYEQILNVLTQGETVAMAIRRLSKNRTKIPSASQKWKKKKSKMCEKERNEAEVEAAVIEQQQMLQLTEICDRLVQRGIIDIYETPYERITFTLRQLREKQQKCRQTIASTVKDDDDVLDMFAEDFDTKQGSSSSAGNLEVFKEPQAPGVNRETEAATPSTAEAEEDGVLWEYKTENTDQAETKGPFSTTQMMGWAQDGTFGKGVFCRRYKSQGQFYNSSRLDFELYE